MKQQITAQITLIRCRFYECKWMCLLIYEALTMSLSPYQFQLLTSSSRDICNNFEHFYTYFNLLINEKLTTFTPCSVHFNHRRHILSLNEHLTSQQSIWLFIEHNSPYLNELFPDKHQVFIFRDVFLMALSTTLKSKFTLAVRKAWQNILHVFTNMVLARVHGYSNVISMQQYRNRFQESKSFNGKLRRDP